MGQNARQHSDFLRKAGAIWLDKPAEIDRIENKKQARKFVEHLVNVLKAMFSRRGEIGRPSVGKVMGHYIFFVRFAMWTLVSAT